MMSDSKASSDFALRMLADLIREQTGISFESTQFDLLHEKLAPLISQGNFRTPLDYYYYLKYETATDQEWRRLQSALAVNETYFWREVEQIRAVAEIIVPRLQKATDGMPIRIWHTACATGEEPYSMAIALTEAGCYRQGPIEILASDFNVRALEKAQEGLYRQRALRFLPEPVQNQYFTSVSAGQYLLSDAIRQRVEFRYINLLNESVMTAMHNFEIIFCRNVFIYFSDVAVRRVANWFYPALEKQGYLFVGAVESLLRLTNLYDLVEVGNAFGYQKRLPESDQQSRLASAWQSRSDPQAADAWQTSLRSNLLSTDSASEPPQIDDSDQGPGESVLLSGNF